MIQKTKKTVVTNYHIYEVNTAAARSAMVSCVNGNYSLYINNRSVYSGKTISDCVKYGKEHGYIKRDFVPHW